MLKKNRKYIENLKREGKLTFRNNRGITLVALVVTIIVLIILAAVTISLLVGQNGIITRAREGAGNYTQAEKEEQDMLDNAEDYIDSIVGVDWDKVLENAVKHPAQVKSQTIGIGTDGKTVNMDLWEYTLMENRTMH